MLAPVVSPTVIRVSWAFDCGFDKCDVDFRHVHHDFEGAFGDGSVCIGEGFGQHTRVICHDNPHLSLHQPQALGAPPLSMIAFHRRSVSAWSSVAT